MSDTDNSYDNAPPLTPEQPSQAPLPAPPRYYVPGYGPMQQQNMPWTPPPAGTGPQPQNLPWRPDLPSGGGEFREVPSNQQAPPMVNPLQNLIQQFAPQLGSFWQGQLDRRRDFQTRAAGIDPRFHPPPWREPYLPAQQRGSGEMGKPWYQIEGAENWPGVYAGPGMPDFRQAIGIVAGMRSFGPPSAMPFYNNAAQLAQQYAPILDMISGGKFSRNFLAAQQGRFKLMEDQIMLNQEMGLAKHQQELMQYGSIFDGFNSHAFSKDDTENARIAHQKLEELTQYDPIAAGILHNQGIRALEKYQQNQDKRFRDAYASYTSMRKSRDASGTLSASNDGEGDSSGAPDPGYDKPKIPDVEGKPADPTTKTDTPDIEAEQEKIDQGLRKKYNLGANDLEMAHKHYAGAMETDDRKNFAKYDPDSQKRILAASAEIKKDVDRALDNPSLSEDQKFNQIARYDRDRANELKGLANYDLDPQSISTRDNKRFTMTDMARRFSNNNYNPDNFKQIHQLKHDAEKPMLSAQMLDTASTEVLRALKPISEGERNLGRIYDQVVAGTWTGDPKYKKLAQALTTYAQAVSRSESGQGRPYVTIVHDMLKGGLQPTDSPASIRAAMQTDNNVAYGAVNGWNDMFRNITGTNKNIPGWSTKVEANMQAKREMRADTGEMPENASPELKALSKAPSAKDRPAFKRDESPPLTQKNISDLNNIINDPNVSEDRKQKAREALSRGGAPGY